MEIGPLLKKLGLSEKESEIYLATLELGSAVASEIAKKANINRSTTYVVLETLRGRNLIAETSHGGIKKYAPLSPAMLADQFEKKAAEFIEHAKIARKIIAELKISTEKISREPKISFFSGDQATSKAIISAIQSLEEIRGNQLSAASQQLKGVNVYDDRVILVAPNSREGVVIESPELASAFRKAFGTA